MSASSARLALAALVCGIAACGNASEATHDGAPPPDAGLLADARPPLDARVADAARDRDGDGHPADTDCNDEDSSVWQTLPYTLRDVDGDNHTVATSGTICSGASLPVGYSTVPGGPDCNDADPAAFATVTGFVDADGDGFGVGPAMTFCNAGTLPAGFAAIDGDCAAEDPARWVELAYNFRDADGDGAAMTATTTTRR